MKRFFGFIESFVSNTRYCDAKLYVVFRVLSPIPTPKPLNFLGISPKDPDASDLLVTKVLIFICFVYT